MQFQNIYPSWHLFTAMRHSLPDSKVDTDAAKTGSLTLFKSKVTEKRIVSFWNTREQLRLNIMISLAKWMASTPRTGWVRGNAAAAESILAQLNEIRNEAEKLRIENHKLKNDLVPKVRDLASLDEVFTIEFTHYSRSSKQRYPGEITLAWAAIFQIIGPSFFSPATQAKLDQVLDRHIEQMSGKHMIGLNAGIVDTIKIQMTAHGLLRIYSAQSTTGGENEFIVLTDLGNKTLLELKTVKTQPIHF